MRQEGLEPNNALKDQKLALEWISKYGAGFGGNPAEITVIGVSVGSGERHIIIELIECSNFDECLPFFNSEIPCLSSKESLQWEVHHYS